MWWLWFKIRNKCLGSLPFPRSMATKYRHKGTTTIHRWFTGTQIQTASSPSRTQITTIIIYRWSGQSHMNSRSKRIVAKGSETWCTPNMWAATRESDLVIKRSLSRRVQLVGRSWCRIRTRTLCGCHSPSTGDRRRHREWRKPSRLGIWRLGLGW